MNMQITPSAAVSSYSSASESQARQGYLGALAAALRNGDVVAAQQALIELRGVGGGVSPDALFEKIDNSIKSSRTDEIKSASLALDEYRKSGQVDPYHNSEKMPGAQKAPLPVQLMAASGTGTLVNIKV
ncbi:hypothetical protein ICN35_02990 [Polynucleobacter sp. es-GGE-1]|jgi:hypothetical protein|uniref:hypothetical protein n=1 Tax=unclassified Polynucleobacter TaxID=2640945 RepID=UPI001BFEBDD4|nr:MULTISPECIES: hypothetical protein [unclassified Polynucleobacter]MBU3634410.1 hypothetical protein [Polynucleobacter sp. es-GGE-1]MEA9599056.1 hypothetical protein [Polynucleobacter sp. AP-Sanab-80-C2]QWD71102.1 hypothetical protein C2756_03810 [Polynucleobacter sp. UB-Siik-W21]QWE07347.1 hypothetical protein AOC29_03905 [Polynucleobacter sp. JS-JIR-5-A7]